MKKTVSVNIKGTNFLIEEDAYELLQDYMDRLSLVLQHEEGSKEIIEDIELRIAEICSTKLSDSKTVIELHEIEEILEALGAPEEYVDEDEGTTAYQHEEKRSSNTNDRRLFRDAENATIGGVCSGLSNYFGIDVVIIRAIFVVFFLFGGFGFPLYIILWVIIPKAENTIDRLRMKGRPITVETVKEEVENAAERIKSESKSIASKLRHDKHYKHRISRGRRIFATLFGLGFVMLGLFLLVSLLIFVVNGFQFVPVQGDEGFISITEFGELIMSNPADVKWAWISGLMGTISGILFLLLLGSMLIFRISNKWSKYSLGLLFFTGIVGTAIFGTLIIKSGRDMVVEGEIERAVGSVQSEELVIIPRLTQLKSMESFDVKSSGNFGLFGIEGDHISNYGVKINYVPSSDSLFHIKQNLSAHSSSHKSALKKSKHIEHGIILKGDTLYVDVKYLYPKKDKLRDQTVNIIIEIPADKSVRLKDRLIHLGVPDVREEIDHPYYREEGYIRSDGSYDHYLDD